MLQATNAQGLGSEPERGYPAPRADPAHVEYARDRVARWRWTRLQTFNRKEHKKSDGLPQCLQPGLAMSSLGTNTIGKLY